MYSIHWSSLGGLLAHDDLRCKAVQDQQHIRPAKVLTSVKKQRTSEYPSESEYQNITKECSHNECVRKTRKRSDTSGADRAKLAMISNQHNLLGTHPW